MPTNAYVIGEDKNRRNINSKHYLMSDGSHQAQISVLPQHYPGDDGDWYDIDTDLHDEAEFDLIEGPVSSVANKMFQDRRSEIKTLKNMNLFDRDAYGYMPLRVPFAASLPRQFRRGYSLGRGDFKVTFVPIGASTAKGTVDRTGDRGNIIEYQDAWNDTDVTLEVTVSGIKETMILKSENAPKTFSFEILGDVAEGETLTDALYMLPAWLVDASGTKRDVAQTVRKDGERTFIDLVVNDEGLTYPIVVDPTVNTSAGSNTKMNVILEGYPTQVGSGYTIGYIGDSSQHMDLLLGFTMGALGLNPSIAISNAYLTIPLQGANNPVNPVKWRVDTITQGWVQGAVTWNTAPASVNHGNTELSYIPPNTYGDFNMIIDCTKSVQYYITGAPFDGFRVRSGVDNIPGNIYASNAWYSILTVRYIAKPTAPVVITPNGGDIWNASHLITWGASESPAITDIDTGWSQPFSWNFEIGTGFSDSLQYVTQSFWTNNIAYVTQIMIKFSQPSTGTMRLSLYNAQGQGTSGADMQPTSEIAGQTISVAGLTFGVATLNVQLAPNTRYILVARSLTGNQYTYLINIPTTGENSYGGTSFGYWTHGNSAPMPIRIVVGAGPSTALRYNVQLSTNNGGSWSDIVALTSPGATSYGYDFSAVPQNSQSLIRVRAWDGLNYGDFDQSNGVFTIVHNTAPTAPTSLSPNSVVLNKNTPIVLSWSHNDPNGDVQYRYDIQWRPQGASNWINVSGITSQTSYTAPTGTFPVGVIEWQVRTYDPAGLSGPYSAQASFTAGIVPDSPVFTNPTSGATISTANPAVTWNSVGQVSYRLIVLNAAASVTLYDSGEVASPSKSVTMAYSLSNSTTYTVRLAIKQADGLWSSFSSIQITTSFTVPATPTLSFAAYPRDGYIQVQVVPGFPATVSIYLVELFRMESGQWVRIATSSLVNQGLTYFDYSVASDIIPQYRAVVTSASGTKAEVVMTGPAIKLTGVWLHNVGAPAATAKQFMYDGTGRTTEWEPELTLNQFIGRKFSVADFGGGEQSRISVTLDLSANGGDLASLTSLVSSKSILCYRDGRGRKMIGVVPKLPTTDEIYGNTASIEIVAVDYTEGV